MRPLFFPLQIRWPGLILVRSDGKISVKKSSAPAQPTQASPSSNSAPKQTSRNQISSPIRSSFDMLTGPGASQSSFASPPHAHKPVTRERGCSLSVLEHSSFPGHLGRDPSMISSGPRQSISLPLQRSQEQFAQPPRQAAYPFYHHQAPPSSSQPSINNLSSPSDSSTGYSYVEPVGGPRRGSWCPGGSNWNEFAPMPPDDLGPPPFYTKLPSPTSTSQLGRRQLVKNVDQYLRISSKWYRAGAIVSSSNMHRLGRTSDRIRPSILPGWSGLGRLEEEEHIKLEPESSINSAVTSQLLLSSPSQPGSFDNENNCPIGLSSAEMAREPPSEANQSVSWSFPKGGTLSYAYTGLEHDPVNPAGFTPSDPIECFGNVWQTLLKIRPSKPFTLGIGINLCVPGVKMKTATDSVEFERLAHEKPRFTPLSHVQEYGFTQNFISHNNKHNNLSRPLHGLLGIVKGL
ncbi:hypothetical protein PCASD_25502 [Puccinia coronata f. sp. avenae]|uniref:Uncharacterized protein n=1 Tax=Puccinia coronata f. sp. avenae TaxID=200324 RepID=A0A2N5S1Q8_9BASI|nr:hypothetical protein PCASD_25502 [Puccinia coronata f. sp. avenae]